MTASTHHITLDVLADYFAELLDDTREEAVELHIADCDRCAASAHWLHSLPRLDLEGWTARSHSEATLRAAVAASLDEAEQTNAEPSLKERLHRWRESLKDQALHLIKETSGALSRGLDVLMPPPGWELGMRTLQTEAPAVFRTPDPLAGTEPAEQAPTVRLLRKGIGVEVRVEHVEPSEEPRLVALIPAREGGRVAVQVLKPAPHEAKTQIARFQQDDGDFVVVLEPVVYEQDPSTD